MRLARRTHPEQRHQGDGELEALLAASRAANQSSDIDTALEAILEAAIRLVHADEGSIQLVDRATMTLEVVASRGLPFEARRQRVALGQGISGTVAVTGQPLLLPSAIDVDRFVGHVPKERRIFGAICVPLRAGEETVGVLNVNAMRPASGFSDRDLRLASIFAETAALAIATSRLRGETRRHAIELELLRGAATRLGSSLDLQAVAETTLQDAMAIAGTDAAFICVSADNGRDVDLARFSGLSREALLHVLSAPTFRRQAVPADVRMVDNPRLDPLFAPLAHDIGARSLMLLPLRTADGQAGGVLGVVVPPDVGDEQRKLLRTYATQAGLAISNALLHQRVSVHEEELNTIVTTLDFPIVMIDENGNFRAINPAAGLTWRLSPEFEIGQSARGKFPPEIEDLVLDREDDVEIEAEIESATSTRVYRLMAATVRGGRGAGSRIFSAMDISDERDLERRKADFLAVIGHELRTPLTSIKGFSRTLAARGQSLPPEVHQRAIDTICAQSDRLERLIEDLLFVSKIERHRPPLHLSEEEIGDICVTVVKELRARYPQRTIRFNRPASPVMATTDRVKVEQILSHLVDNAVKYSPHGRPVVITLAAETYQVTIAVKDEGPGIYSGDLDAIFEPFTQLDASATREAGGTGVGLYVSRTLAEAMGARIEVRSALGRGSTFSIVLPRRPMDQPE